MGTKPFGFQMSLLRYSVPSAGLQKQNEIELLLETNNMFKHGQIVNKLKTQIANKYVEANVLASIRL
jgi:hypothetical protein